MTHREIFKEELAKNLDLSRFSPRFADECFDDANISDSDSESNVRYSAIDCAREIVSEFQYAHHYGY